MLFHAHYQIGDRLQAGALIGRVVTGDASLPLSVGVTTKISGVLRGILHVNRDTEYGRRRAFADIAGYEDFARLVPIVDYEALRPYIETQLEVGTPALTHDAPLMYARTSVTTGAPKFVPIVEAELHGQKRHMALLTLLQYDFDRGAFAGKLWAMAASAEEGRFDNGMPYGSASGFL